MKNAKRDLENRGERTGWGGVCVPEGVDGGDRPGVGVDAFRYGSTCSVPARKSTRGWPCTLSLGAGPPTACPVFDHGESLARPIRRVRTKRHSSCWKGRSAWREPLFALLNRQGYDLVRWTKRETGIGPAALSQVIWAGDRGADLPFLGSGHLRRSKNGNRGSLCASAPSGCSLLVSSISKHCSFAFYLVGGHRSARHPADLGSRNSLESHQAYVNGRFGGHAMRGMVGPHVGGFAVGPPLSPGGAPHPFEATLNLTSSSKTRHRSTALGLDRSWPHSPCGPPLSFSTSDWLGVCQNLGPRPLEGVEWKRDAPFVAVDETEPAEQSRGTKGPGVSPGGVRCPKDPTTRFHVLASVVPFRWPCHARTPTGPRPLWI